jgi:hypothetical protein
MATRSDQDVNDAGLAADFPWDTLEPDFQYPLPARPGAHKHDCLELIRLVMAYRASWEIYILEDDTWIAQGVTHSNRWARFETDNPRDLDRQIEAV